MPWNATHRWVFPSFRLVVSETRTPSMQWIGGYTRRRYVDGLYLAFSNGGWSPLSFAVSFWSSGAQPYTQLSFGGTLAGHESDEVRLLDHPRLMLPNLGSTTSADVLNQWSGWFEVYASGPIQLSAWNEIYDKGATETKGQLFVRTLDRAEAGMPRVGPLEFPDEPGRPSIVWRVAPTPVPGPAPTPSPVPAPGPVPPPAEDARCGPLRATIKALTEDILTLQADLATAAPGEKAGLVALINVLKADRTAQTDRARSLACRST